MELWNCVLTQYLAEYQGKDAIMLCWEKAPTRHERENTVPTVSQAMRRSRQSETRAQVSSVPRLFGALGTAPRRRVENEK